MKNINSSFFLFYLCLSCYSQAIIIVDSVSGEPLPFVAVKYQNTGIYSNESGLINLDRAQIKNIELSFLGYYDLTLKVFEIRDTIFMKPKVNILDEVNVSSHKKNKLETILPLKKANSYGSWVLSPRTEIASIIYPKNEYINSYVERVEIFFDEISENQNEREKYNDVQAILRINIYKTKNYNKLENHIYRSEPIRLNSYNGGKIVLDLSNQLIKLPKEGLCFSLEMIGYLKDGNIIQKDSFIRPILTNKIGDQFSSVTFIKYVFNDEKNFQSLNEILKKNSAKGKDIDRNLSIGLNLLLIDED